MNVGRSKREVTTRYQVSGGREVTFAAGTSCNPMKTTGDGLLAVKVR